MERKFEFVLKENKQNRLTITPSRVTLKLTLDQLSKKDIYLDKVSKILDIFPEKENSFRVGSFNSDTNVFNFTNDSKKYLVKIDIQKQSVEERRLR